MFNRFASVLATALISLTLSSSPALAGWGTLTMTDGAGEGVKYKHTLFGQKSMEAEDRLGDSYVHKRGLLGVNRETGASVLGNGFDVKHGLLSGKTYKAGDILGDSFKSKKMFFGLGPRNTTVDLHGMSGLVHGIMHRSDTPMQAFGGGPGASPSGATAGPDMQGPDPRMDLPPQDAQQQP